MRFLLQKIQAHRQETHNRRYPRNKIRTQKAEILEEPVCHILFQVQGLISREVVENVQNSSTTHDGPNLSTPLLVKEESAQLKKADCLVCRLVG